MILGHSILARVHVTDNVAQLKYIVKFISYNVVLVGGFQVSHSAVCSSRDITMMLFSLWCHAIILCRIIYLSGHSSVRC